MEYSNSLEQYLDLFVKNKALFSSNTQTWFTPLREKAYDFLQGKRLPVTSDEGYEKTSVNEMFAPDLGINIERKNLITSNKSFSCGVETLNAIKIYVHNDIPVRIELPKGMSKLPEGLHIENLHNLPYGEQPVVSMLLNNLMDNPRHVAEALNIMLGGDGIFIKIISGHAIDVPIQIINYSGASIPLLSNRRVIIVAEENSSVNVLNCDHSINVKAETLQVINALTVICAEKSSHIRYVEMEETEYGVSRLSNNHVDMGQSSEVSIGCITLKNGISRNNFKVNCSKNDAVVRIDGLVIGKNRSHIDNYTEINHGSDHCKSDQLFKYALYDNSNGAFAGKITVMPDSRFNEAFQNNRNIVVSSGARMYSKPQLLIYNDDVKCSHGATTGQLDSNAIYYMRTRGIPLTEAKSMLMQAFMNDVVEKIDFPGFNERLRHLVERRLKGDDILCGSCKIRPEND